MIVSGKETLILSLILSLLVLVSRARAGEAVGDTWKLEDLYPSVQAWETAKSQLESRLGSFDACKGKLKDEKTRGECLKQFFDFEKDLKRLELYASMASDQDITNAKAFARKQSADLLDTRFAQTVSFLAPELAALGPKLEKAIRKNPKADEAFFLQNILRQAPHIRSGEVENILAATGDLVSGIQDTHDQLTTSDLPWPTVTLADGTKALLNQSGYPKYRGTPVRTDRKKVFDAFWKVWKSYEATSGALMNGNINSHVFERNARAYTSCLAAALDGGNIPEDVYRTLLRETNANLPTLHRYLKLRGRMLGIPDLRYYDIYPPIVKLDRKFTFPEAKHRVLKALAPLGDTYVKELSDGFDRRWIDVFPRKGKKGGGYSAGEAYDVHPYILLNYVGNYDSVSTLAHEAGHALHSSLANRSQPYPKADYSIFVAEIASTLDEALLLDQALKEAKDGQERLFYLGNALENLRQTYFRQVSFADFELAMHTEVEQGRPLTGEKLTKMYGDLLKRYYGHGKVLTIDDAYAIEWAFIPHFYANFYVYQYATSIAASSMFADEILEKKPGAVDKFLNLLKAGGSDYPYELVKNAGVDLATPAPYQSLMKRMNRIMDEIEKILKTHRK